MLQLPAGVTVAAMMKATGWQPHSVRGFLAGVIRKRLKLKLGSKKVDGDRVYQITSGGAGDAATTRQSNSRVAQYHAAREDRFDSAEPTATRCRGHTFA
jgi:hypothetical protein